MPDGLSFQEAMDEFMALSAQPAPAPAAGAPGAAQGAQGSTTAAPPEPHEEVAESRPAQTPAESPVGAQGQTASPPAWGLVDEPPSGDGPPDMDLSWAPSQPRTFEEFEPHPAPAVSEPAAPAEAAPVAPPPVWTPAVQEARPESPVPVDHADTDLPERQIAALERWLDAVIARRQRQDAS